MSFRLIILLLYSLYILRSSINIQIRVLDGSNGKVVMNLPARLRRWDVHGESLAIEGKGADVIVDWIADDEDETAKIQINRLMGVIIRSSTMTFYLSPLLYYIIMSSTSF